MPPGTEDFTKAFDDFVSRLMIELGNGRTLALQGWTAF
jgi:hypothetical protein